MLLEKLSNAFGPSGYEADVKEIVREELGDGSVQDRFGNLYLEKKGQSLTKVLLVAHLDEVGFQVQSITAEGQLRMQSLGKWSDAVMTAQRVRIKTRDGKFVPGTFSSIPPHLSFSSNSGSPGYSVDDSLVDIGCSSFEEVKAAGIKPGDPAVPDTLFQELGEGNRYIGKAFDDRVGCAVLLEVEKNLRKQQLEPTVVYGFSVQEELGARGAVALAESVKPDIAIVLEGPPADDVISRPRTEQQGRCGEGPQIRVRDEGAVSCPSLVAEFEQLSEQKGIPSQTAVRRRALTDAQSIQYAAGGVKCVVLGVPCRYIHSPNSIVFQSDIEACSRLVQEYLKGFKS